MLCRGTKRWFSQVPRAVVRTVSHPALISAMVTQFENHVHVALSPPATPAAEGLHPLTLQGPTGIEL